MIKSNKSVMSEAKIRKDSDKNYMNEEQLAFFEQRLLDLYQTTCHRIQEVKDQIATPVQEGDENDKASWIEQSSIALRIVDREQKLIKKIRKSLERIKAGDYGYCLESGEPIGIERLLVRPTAEYSAEVKAVKELKENHYKD